MVLELIMVGLTTSLLITPNRMVAEYNDALVLVTDNIIDNQAELIQFMELWIKTNKPLLIICDDISPECLGFIVLNRTQKGLPIVVVKAPSLGNNKLETLRDISIMCGAKFISNQIGMKIGKVMLNDLGKAKKIEVSQNNTLIFDGNCNKEELKGRIEVLKDHIASNDSVYAKEQYQERLGKLCGGVAAIHIGASTSTELTEKKHRYEDALNATRAAIEEGIVPGGGTTLIRVIQNLSVEGDNIDEQNGIDIFKKALEAPLFYIADNAGYKGDIIVEKVKALKTNHGFNAVNGKYLDLVKDGIVDPAKVTRSSLENAVSIAGLVLTTDSIIVNEKDKK
jgi:chaperonin GroEL